MNAYKEIPAGKADASNPDPRVRTTAFYPLTFSYYIWHMSLSP